MRLQLPPHYTTLHYTNYITLQQQLQLLLPLHCTTPHLTNYTTPQLQLQLQLQLHYTNYTTLQLQQHYTTTTTTILLRHTTSSSCGGDGEVTTATMATTPKKNSNHLSVHQWIRSAIRDSKEPTSPIGFLFLKLPPSPCAALLAQASNLCPQSMMYIVQYSASK